MAVKHAKFAVTCTPAPTTPVTVDYMTVDGIGVAFTDYIPETGQITFAAGVTEQTIIVPIRGDTTSLDIKNFSLKLLTPVEAKIVTALAECQISGPPIYAAVPFPGTRVALIGDSITYANTGYNPLGQVGTGTTAAERNAYYSTGMTGWFVYANALLGHPFELETGMQPNTNPGVNADEPNRGYNFAVYSSQTAQWQEADFDPIASDATVSHNIGPVLNAQTYIDKWDVAFMMGGTNDLSAGLSVTSVLNNLKSYAFNFAKQGKWVFVLTVTPRTGDLLGGSGNNPGLDIAEQATIMSYIQQINQGLRDWIASENPANIWLVDSYANLVGPDASLIADNPTDPAGLVSATTATTNTLSNGVTQYITPSTAGNFRPEAPNIRFFYDGLHPTPAGGYVIGKDIAAVVKGAAGTTLPGAALTSVGPLTIGPNLMVAGTNGLAVAASVSAPQSPRVVGQPLVLGRAIGLGAPLTDATHPTSGVADAPADDEYANHGLGYTHGPVPNYYFLYRCNNGSDGPTGSNGDPTGESYSNFNNYTFSQFVGGLPDLAPYMVDSTWADGCLTTALVTGTIDGESVPGFQMTFQAPSGLTHNEGFVLRYVVTESQNGVWNNFGYEGSATQRASPSPPYTPGETIAADCVITLAGVNGQPLSSNMISCRLTANFISYDPANGNTSSAVISGIALSESYYPFDNVAVCHQHPETKTLRLRTPAVTAPTSGATETQVYLQLDWQFAFDCSSTAASATITVYAPRAATLTGSTL